MKTNHVRSNIVQDDGMTTIGFRPPSSQAVALRTGEPAGAAPTKLDTSATSIPWEARPR